MTARVVEAALIDDTKSLDDGAIDFPMFAPGQWMRKAYAKSGFFDPAMKIGDYTPEQRRILLYAPAGELHAPAGIDAVGSTYEGRDQPVQPHLSTPRAESFRVRNGRRSSVSSPAGPAPTAAVPACRKRCAAA